MTKMTRTDYIYSRPKGRRTSFSAVATAIREGQITCHLVDGKIYIEEEEVDAYFDKKRAAKLAALQGANLFA